MLTGMIRIRLARIDADRTRFSAAYVLTFPLINYDKTRQKVTRSDP